MIISPYVFATGSAPVLWTPAQLGSSLYGWYQADNVLNTFGTGSPTTVNIMYDLSGNAHHATSTGTSGTPPQLQTGGLGGHGYFNMTAGATTGYSLAGTAGFLNAKTAGNFAGMVNFTYTGTALGEVFNTETPSSGFARMYVRYPDTTAQRVSLLGRRLDADTLVRAITPANVVGNTVLITCIDYALGTQEIRANGSRLLTGTFLTAGTTSATDSNRLAYYGFPTGNTFGGGTYEFLIGNSSWSASDRQKIEGYLAWRYASQSSLPVGHPYRNAPPVASTNWTPDKLTTPPVLWNKETGLVLGTTTDIAQWNDDSGNDYHLLSATTANRPVVVTAGLNGLPVAQFDGSNDYLATGSSAFGIIRKKSFVWALHLYKRTAAGSAADKGIFSVRFSSNGWIATYSGSTRGVTTPTWLVRRVESDPTAFIDGPTALGTSWHIYLGTIDYTTGKGVLYIDGVAVTTNNSLAPVGTTADVAASNVVLGGYDVASGYSDMSLAENIIGNASITSTEIDKLFGYIAWKWGLQANLPSGHPYKSAPP